MAGQTDVRDPTLYGGCTLLITVRVRMREGTCVTRTTDVTSFVNKMLEQQAFLNHSR